MAYKDDVSKDFRDTFGIIGEGPARVSFEEQKHWEKFKGTNYPYYVSMVDRFLSGWGQASSRKALFIYGARSYDEAMIIADNARARTDQSNVRIHHGKPRVHDPTRYRFEFVDPADKGYTRWYKAGGFSHSEQ